MCLLNDTRCLWGGTLVWDMWQGDVDKSVSNILSPDFVGGSGPDLGSGEAGSKWEIGDRSQQGRSRGTRLLTSH
jgi:hypothetical protein